MNLLTRATIMLAVMATPTIVAAQSMSSGGKPMMMKPPVSKTATITGTVVDVSCKYGQGLGGPEHKMCSEVCADKGLPLAVLGDDGKLYLAASSSMPGDPQNARLKPFAEQHVKVTGKVFSAAGAQAIQIASIDAVK